jgi:peptidoglycan hydrolase-like protein with peptidoglycan-binding domain
LKNHRWTDFAKGYNGKDYAKNNYAVKLRDTYKKTKDHQPSLALRTAQAALLYLGINPGPVDGFDGNKTQKALKQFQETHGMPPTGVLDSATKTTLLDEAFPQG